MKKSHEIVSGPSESTTLEQGKALVAQIAFELNGSLTEWTENKAIIGMWQFNRLNIGEATMRIGVSSGGVVQINGDPFTPHERILNATKEAVLNSVRAAAKISHETTCEDESPGMSL